MTEELHRAAVAYYNNASGDLRQRAWEFFCSLDTNGDRRVSISEFMDFFRQNGYGWIHPDYFRLLDRDKDGWLDFWEVLTMYYIMKTRGVFCRECGACQMGLYFTCVDCFESADPTYDLCVGCYSSQKFYHLHCKFLDSYVLLRSKRGPHPDVNQALTPPQHDCPTRPQWNIWWAAFQALEMAVATISTVGSLAGCSIM